MATEQTIQPQAAPQPQQTPLQQPAPEPPQQTTAVAVNTKEKFTPALCAETIKKLPEQLQGLRNCFAAPFDAFRKAFKDPAEADRVMAKEIDFAAQAMMNNTYLISCAVKQPQSLVNALKNVALTNSTLNPVLKRGYLVPFGGNITFMPSYMGLVDVLVNNGLVRKVEAHCVFEGDKFDVTHGSGGRLFHKPDPWGKRTPETVLGAYYFVVLTDGTEMYATMGKEEVDLIKLRSPSVGKGKQSPWDTDYLEMMKKTLVRRAFKMIPKGGISDDKVRALEAVFDYDEKAEREWIAEQKQTSKRSSFDEEEAEYTEIG